MRPERQGAAPERQHEDCQKDPDPLADPGPRTILRHRPWQETSMRYPPPISLADLVCPKYGTKAEYHQ